MRHGHQPLIRRPVIRILIIWGIQTVALIIMSLILSGLAIDTVGTAVIAAAVIGLSRGRFTRHRCGPAQKPRQVGDRGIMP